jgi:hypothetical protein
MYKNIVGDNILKIIVILLAIIITYILCNKYLGKNESSLEGLTNSKWRKTKDDLKKDTKTEDNIDKKEWSSDLKLINRNLNTQMLKTLQDLMAEPKININGNNYIKLEKYKNLSDIVISLEDYFSNDYLTKKELFD